VAESVVYLFSDTLEGKSLELLAIIGLFYGEQELSVVNILTRLLRERYVYSVSVQSTLNLESIHKLDQTVDEDLDWWDALALLLVGLSTGALSFL
jgi:hypothetical protein